MSKNYGTSDAVQGAVALAKAAGKVAAGNYVGAAKDALTNIHKILPIIILIIALPLLIIIGVYASLQSLLFGWLGGDKMTADEQAAAEKAWSIAQYQTIEKDMFSEKGVFIVNEKTASDKIMEQLKSNIPDIDKYIEKGYKQMVLASEEENYVYPQIGDNEPLCILVNESNNPMLEIKPTERGQLYQNSLYILNKTGQSYIVHFDCEQYIKTGYGPMFFSYLYQLKKENDMAVERAKVEQEIKTAQKDACKSDIKPCGKCDGCIEFNQKREWENLKAEWCINAEEKGGMPCNDCSWCKKFEDKYRILLSRCTALKKYPCKTCENCKDFLDKNSHLHLRDEDAETHGEDKAKAETQKFLKFTKENLKDILVTGVSVAVDSKYKIPEYLGFGDNLTYNMTIYTVDVHLTDFEKLADIYGIKEKQENYKNNPEAAKQATLEKMKTALEAQDSVLSYLQDIGYARSSIYWQFSQRIYRRIFEKFTDFSERNILPVLNGEIVHYESDVDSPLFRTIKITGPAGENVTLFSDATIFKIDQEKKVIVFQDANNTSMLYEYRHIDIPQELIDQYNADHKGGESITYKANTVIGKIPEKTDEEKQQDEETGEVSPTYILFGVSKYSIFTQKFEPIDPRPLIRGKINITLLSTGYCWPAPSNLIVVKDAVFEGNQPHRGILIANDTRELTVGKPVVAALNGQVMEVGQNYVLIKHMNGTSTYYKNLEDIKVKAKQYVVLGQVIGYIQKNADGLYFEVRNNNADEGKQITAKESGKVSFVEKSQFVDITTGQKHDQYMVFITTQDNLRTNYFNLKTVSVKKGDKVSAGQVIGTLGKTEYLYDYPLNYFPQEEVNWKRK